MSKTHTPTKTQSKDEVKQQNAAAVQTVKSNQQDEDTGAEEEDDEEGEGKQKPIFMYECTAADNPAAGMSKEDILTKLTNKEIDTAAALRLLDQVGRAGKQMKFGMFADRDGVSIYGLQKLPVTFREENLLLLCDHVESGELRKFIEEARKAGHFQTQEKTPKRIPKPRGKKKAEEPAK